MSIRDKFAVACIATALAGAGITCNQIATAHAERAPATQVVDGPRAPARAEANADAERYGEREKSSDKQQAYQGGQYLVIGISTTAAVVLLVLLLLLL